MAEKVCAVRAYYIITIIAVTISFPFRDISIPDNRLFPLYVYYLYDIFSM